MFHTPFVITFTLILSLPLIFLIAPHIIPPNKQNQILQISLTDELEDLSLFRRATLSSTTSSRSNHKPKIAFLFLTTSPLFFSPLWEKFFSTTNSIHLYNIYIHIDPLSASSVSTTLTGVFTGRSIAASKRTERSSPTLISAERRLLATALLHDPLNAYFALLSETCIPLHSFPFVYSTLFGGGSDLVLGGFFKYWRNQKRMSFIEILDDPPPFLKERYDARGESVMEPEVPFKEFKIGSQFYVLTREQAGVVIRDRRLWRKFRLPCLTQDNCYPEEHYFPTLLSMEDPNGCAGFSLTRVNWTDSVDGHPHTYRAEEISSDLIVKLREGNETSMVIGGRSYEYLFARKFDRSCLKPLMEIADDVIFQD